MAISIIKPEIKCDRCNSVRQERSLNDLYHTHVLKCNVGAFEKIKNGTRKAEIVRNDKNYKVNDILILKEWNSKSLSFTGNETEVVITDIQAGGPIPFGFICISISLKR